MVSFFWEMIGEQKFMLSKTSQALRDNWFVLPLIQNMDDMVYICVSQRLIPGVLPGVSLPYF